MATSPIDQNLNSDRQVLVKMVHRHAHDIRNCFGGLDLEATLISELSGDPEGGVGGPDQTSSSNDGWVCENTPHDGGYAPACGGDSRRLAAIVALETGKLRVPQPIY